MKTISNPQIILAGTWVVAMLIYLLGDVPRIYRGDMPDMRQMGLMHLPRVVLPMTVFLLLRVSADQQPNR